jgi:hypothetical protein
MKKILILVVVLAFVPLLSFAELGVGASAYFNSPVLVGQSIDTHQLWEGGFTFGGDVRWKFLKILQLDVPVLVAIDDVSSIGLLPNFGLAFDLAILRLSAGVGPTVLFLLSDVTDPALLGFNAKANADIKLGRISFGLSYIMALNFDNGVALDKSTGMLGANVLFWF